MSKGKRHSFKCGFEVSSHTRWYPYVVGHACGSQPVIGKEKGTDTYLCRNHYEARNKYFTDSIRLLTQGELDMIASKEAGHKERAK